MLKTKIQFILFLFMSITLFQSCIKDDFVNDTIDPELRIITIVDTIEINSEFLFEAMYLNNIGLTEDVELIWTSSNSEIIEIDNNGLSQALEIGESLISVVYENNGEEFSDELLVSVGQTTSIVSSDIIGEIVTTSSYQLTGAFQLTETATGVDLIFDDSYKASSTLPGLYLYLSNNRNSIAGALEVSKVTVFNGAHTYSINNVGLNDFNFIVYFCKPFNVKVGEAEL